MLHLHLNVLWIMKIGGHIGLAVSYRFQLQVLLVYTDL